MKRILPLLLILMMSVPATAAQARPLDCRDIPQLFQLFLQNHYSVHQLSDTIRNRVAEQFLKALDPSKSVLLESDVEKLKPQVATLFGEVQTDRCQGFEPIRQLVIQRTKEVKAYAEKFLGDSYKFDENTELILNPDQRGYPKTLDERNGLVAKQIHFQVSNYLLADTKLGEAKRLLKKRYELSVRRSEEKTFQDYMTSYLESFAVSLDPHSSFLGADTLEDFQIHMQLSLEGIGASLTSEDGYTVIEDLIPGGSADKLKILHPKDKIIAVAQGEAKPVTVIDMDLRDVVKLIRGKKGTKVKLTILRQGQQAFVVPIIRDKIDLKDQAAKLTFEDRKVGDRTLKIGVIDLPSFYGGGKGEARSSYGDMKASLEEARAKKVDGIVLDLSRNGGGLLDQAVKIAGLFIKKGGVVATKTTGGHVETLDDSDPEVIYTGPLVVLTSRISASASEILAGALKDYHRALIVGGDHTFGKGTVQVLANLPESLGAMKVTTGMFFLPSGLSTQHLGVASDIILPSLYNTDDVGEKKLDYSLEQQKIDSFISSEANSSDPTQHWQPVDNSLVEHLNEAAQKRVAASEKFAQIKKDLDETVRNKGIVRLAELRKRANEDKKTGLKHYKKDSKELTPDKEKPEDNPLLQESANILADMITLEQKM